jgi:hypothetical protein
MGSCSRFWRESYEMDKNVLCDKLFVLLRQEVLSGGKRFQWAMCMLIIWEYFDTKLL